MNHLKCKLDRLFCSVFRPPLSLCPWQCEGLITPNNNNKKKTCAAHGLTQCTNRPTHSGFGIRRRKAGKVELDGDIFRHCNQPAQKRVVSVASKTKPPFIYIYFQLLRVNEVRILRNPNRNPIPMYTSICVIFYTNPNPCPPLSQTLTLTL